jgi:NTP pyrophosphatase (non-canonical NTP hydrolase)
MRIPDITEDRSIKLFYRKFGRDFMSRLKKLNEEVAELNEAVDIYNTLKDVKPELIGELLEHIDDELSDVQGTFTHLSSIRERYQKDMLESCIDKVVKREKDPNYKRFKQ